MGKATLAHVEKLNQERLVTGLVMPSPKPYPCEFAASQARQWYCSLKTMVLSKKSMVHVWCGAQH